MKSVNGAVSQRRCARLDIYIAKRRFPSVHNVCDLSVGDDALHVEGVTQRSVNPAVIGLDARGVAGDLRETVWEALFLPLPPDAVKECVMEVEERVARGGEPVLLWASQLSLRTPGSKRG